MRFWKLIQAAMGSQCRSASSGAERKPGCAAGVRYNQMLLMLESDRRSLVQRSRTGHESSLVFLTETKLILTDQ